MYSVQRAAIQFQTVTTFSPVISAIGLYLSCCLSKAFHEIFFILTAKGFLLKKGHQQTHCQGGYYIFLHLLSGMVSISKMTLSYYENVCHPNKAGRNLDFVTGSRCLKKMEKKITKQHLGKDQMDGFLVDVQNI